MFRWGLFFLCIAVIAGVPGFTGMFGGPNFGARLVSLVFVAAGFGAIAYDLATARRFARR